MRSRILFALCLVVTLPLFAQSAEEKAMMEAMEKAVAPGAEHKALDAFVGKWHTVVKYYPAPGAPALESTGTSENSWVLGGRYVQQKFSGTSMGKPFDGIGYTGYDKIRKQYVSSWMDTMSTGFMVSTGKAGADGKSWTYEGSMDDPMSGASVPLKQTMTAVDKDKNVFEMWSPGPDGKSYKSMEIIYTRKK